MRGKGSNDDHLMDDEYQSGGSRSPRGLAQSYEGLNSRQIAKLRSRLKDRDITPRRQVGDAESMMNDPPMMRPDGTTEY